MAESDKDSVSEYDQFSRRKANTIDSNQRSNAQKKAEVNINISKLKKIIESKKTSGLKSSQKIECNFMVHGKELRFAKNSLYLFNDTNVFRQKLVWIHESKFFELFIILTIFANTAVLAMEDYRFRLSSTLSDKWRNDLIINTEIVFSSVYIFEFVIKMIGMGLVLEQGTYLRDYWNILDFIIVCSSIVNLLPIPIYFMGLKTLRILRPLRSINSVKGLKILMNSLLESLPALGNVVLFLMFTMIVFSILGLQLFNGIFAQRCRLTSQPVGDVWVLDTSVQRICSQYQCPSADYCGNLLSDSNSLKWDRSEIDYAPFLYGFGTFDNMGYAFFTVFQSLTTEGWSKFIYMLIDGYQPAYVYIYFILLIVFGSFFMVNLILAVINDSFVNQQEMMSNQQVVPLKIETLYEDQQEEQKFEINDQNQYEASLNKETQIINLDKADITETMSSQKYDIFGQNKTLQLIKKPSLFLPKNLDLQKAKSNVTDSANEKIINHRKKESQVAFIPKIDLTSPEKRISNSNIGVITEQANDSTEAYKIKTWKQLRTLTMSKVVRVKKVQNIFTRIIQSNAFIIITMILILGNTIVLSLDKYPQSQEENSALDIANTIFTFCFVAEMILKFLGLGIRQYLSDKFNIFDAFIVIISLIDFILSYSDLSSKNISMLSAFRTLRLFRVFKLARSWVTLRTLISVITQTFASIQHFFTLLVIFVIISALIGMELFAYNVRFVDDKPTSNLQFFIYKCENILFFLIVYSKSIAGKSPYVNFDTFSNSLIGIFVLLTSESWNYIMYNHVRALGYPFAAYFVCVLIIGNYILLKLFIAILFYNFSQTSEKEKQMRLNEKSKQKDKQMLGKFENKIQSLEDLEKNESPDTPFTIVSSSTINNRNQVAVKSNNNINLLKKALQNRNDPQTKPMNSQFSEMNAPQTPKTNKSFFNSPMQSSPDALLQSTPGTPAMRHRDSSISRGRGSVFQKNTNGFFSITQQQQDEEEQKQGLIGTSLFILPHTFKGRKYIFRFTFSNGFEIFIIIFILISCVTLVLDSPFEDPNSDLSQIIYYINYVLTIGFILESFLKILSLGFIFNGSHSYLRSITNIIDFIIVLISSMDLFASSNSSFNLSVFKVIRILRILRPLRIISKSEGLKVAMNSLILSLPSIINLQIIIGIVFLLFGIFGVNYFKGTFYYCSGIDNSTLELVDTKNDCFDLGGIWKNQNLNYDNISNALVSLFVLSTTEGWIERMAMGINHRGIDLQPQENFNTAWALYYIVFIFIGSFFLMNLFVGIIVDSFYKENEKQGGIHHLTEQQNLWVQLYGRVLSSFPKKMLYVNTTASSLRKFLQRIIEHPIFDKFILICVLLSTLNFMMIWDNQDKEILGIIQYINTAFVFTFAVEALLKILVYGFSFLRDPANVLDLFIAIITTGGILIEYFKLVSSFRNYTSIFLLLRVTRILRIIKQVQSLRIILNTIVISLPALVNIGSLLFILLFMYSILGMNLFAYVKVNNSDGLHEKANFQTFFLSFFTLLKISTGEEWDLLMDDLIKEQSPDFVCFSVSNYNDYKKYGINGCGSSVAIPYLISFQILFSMIVLSLFIAVILEGYTISERDESSLIKPSEIDLFQSQWGLFDPSGIGFIQARYLYNLMENLEYPFGWQNLSITQSRKNLMIACLSLPLYNSKNEKKPFVNYYDVLERTITIRFQEHYGDFEFKPDKKIKVVRDLIRKKQGYLKKNKQYYLNQYTINDFIAVQIIQERYQKYQSKQMEQFEEEQEQIPQHPNLGQGLEIEMIDDHNLPGANGLNQRYIRDFEENEMY